MKSILSILIVIVLAGCENNSRRQDIWEERYLKKCEDMDRFLNDTIAMKEVIEQIRGDNNYIMLNGIRVPLPKNTSFISFENDTAIVFTEGIKVK